MKRFNLLLALAAVMGFVIVGSAFAAEGKGPGGRPTMGEITKIEGKVLTIKSAREGAEPQTVTCDDNTRITKEAPAKLADLKVGDNVRITQGETRVSGEITKIEGNTLTIKSRRGEDQTITVGDSATIMVSVKATFEDLKVGQQVFASVTDGKATRIGIRAPGAPTGEGRRKGKEGTK
jgi:preprotein translocase subunit YajC